MIFYDMVMEVIFYYPKKLSQGLAKCDGSRTSACSGILYHTSNKQVVARTNFLDSVLCTAYGANGTFEKLRDLGYARIKLYNPKYNKNLSFSFKHFCYISRRQN